VKQYHFFVNKITAVPSEIPSRRRYFHASFRIGKEDAEIHPLEIKL